MNAQDILELLKEKRRRMDIAHGKVIDAFLKGVDLDKARLDYEDCQIALDDLADSLESKLHAVISIGKDLVKE